MDPGQAVAAHQPGDLATAHPRRAPQDQLRVHPPNAIGLPGCGMDLDNLVEQVGIVDVTATGWPVAPLVVTGGRDPQDPARHRNREPLGGELTDEPETYFGSTFSRAK